MDKENTTIPKGKRFEKLIHDIHAQWAPEGAIVKLDDEIVGCQSGVQRQIDISIRVKVAQYDVLIVVECKDKSRPIDVEELGSFSKLLEDVRANKGVLISTSGFTPAAVTMARALAIDTRTYIDTESVDWGTEVTIPVLLIRVKLDSWAASFSSIPGQPWAVPTNVPFPLIETYSPDGTPLGPIITLLGRKWNHDETLHEPGEHTVTLEEHVLVNAGNIQGHTKISAKLRVERYFYLGPLGVRLAGFRDEQNGSLSTKELTTDFIEPASIERGEVPGWRELSEIRNYAVSDIESLPSSETATVTSEEAENRGIPVKAMLVMNYIDALPEQADDLEGSTIAPKF